MKLFDKNGQPIPATRLDGPGVSYHPLRTTAFRCDVLGVVMVHDMPPSVPPTGPEEAKITSPQPLPALIRNGDFSEWEEGS